MTHPAWEIAVSCTDALQGRVHSPKRIHGPSQAGGTPGILGHLHAGCDEDLPDRLFTPQGVLQVMNNLGRGWNPKGVDSHMPPPQNPGKLQEVAGLAAGAGTDVSAVELDVAHFFRFLALAWIGMTSDGGLKLVEINDHLVNELFVLVPHDR